MSAKKLSGAARRRLAKQKAQAMTALGMVMPLIRELSTLNTVRDYRRELNAVYRDLHHERIRREEATSRVFILNVGATLAKAETELAELEALRQRLDQIAPQGAALGYIDAQSPPDVAHDTLSLDEVQQ